MDKLKSNTENERKQMGYLKFSNNRSYPIYEGLNVIGRDIKATIRVKDLTFSKQHAIISIINDNTCFISDFDSSNGTYVRDIKLVPFKLYEIHNLETVIFGDIIASYHTTNLLHSSDEQDNTIANESQIPATQIIPKNFHDIPTQKLNDKNQSQKVHFEETQLVHDAETQLVHDADTLLTTNDQQPSCSKIIDDQPAYSKTTDGQIPNEVNLNASEIFDDAFANETLKQSLQSKKYNLVVDETLPNDSKLNHNNVSLEDDDIILSTQDNDMIDKKAMELQQNENATKDSVDTDDSETDIENEEEFMKNIKEKSTQIYNIIKESDPKTDVEDNLIKTSNVSTSVNNPIVNKNSVISDDEDELDLLADNIHSDSAKNNDDDDDDLLLVPTQLLENKKSNYGEKHIESDNDDDLLAPTQLLSTKNGKNISESDNDDDLLAPTQLLQCKTNNVQADDDMLVPTQLLSASNHQKKTNDEDENNINLLVPTQLLSTKNEKNSENDNDDDLLVPTQLLQCKTNNDQDDDDMLAPTQLLSASNHQMKTNNEDENNINLLVPTQLLSTKNEKNISESDTDDDLLAPTQLLSTKNEKNLIESDHDDLLAPTQLLQSKTGDVQADDDMLAPTQLLSTKNHQNPAGDLAPTQLLLKNNNVNEDDMLAPTQLLQPKSNKSMVSYEDNDLLPPTQLLQSKNQNDSIYSAPTQLLNKVTPKKSCILDTNSPKNTEKKSVNFSENIFDAPTQKLELQNKPSIVTIDERSSQTSSSTNNSQDIHLVLSETDDEISCKKVPQNTEPETQLEVDFQLETQKIYVEQKTSRPDNPLAHMFDEEPTQMTEEIEDKKELPSIEINRKLQIKLQDIKDLKEPSSKKSTCSSDENIEEKRRLQIKLQDIKDLKESSSSKSITSSTSDEHDLRPESRKKRGRKPKTDNKPNVIKVKTKPDSTESEQEVEKPKTTRGRRTTNRQQAVIKIEIKNTRVSEIKKSARLSSISTADKNENSSDMDDFVQIKTRTSKRGHGIPKIDLTEDDDTEEIISPKKKVKKLEYTQDDNSNSSEVIHEKLSKRSIKIEDYSSDENSNNTITSSIYLSTPNTKRRRFDPLNITINDSIKHKIVFTMLNDAELENSVKKLGGSIIDNVNTCTALVTNKISRSLKFLIAVALGKPIVQPKWILDSVKKNSFQDPWNYILVDKEAESKYNFSLKESLKKSCEKKLLTDLVILIATKKNSDVLREIIEISGGKCIQRAPAKNGKAIVVSYEDEKSKYSKYLKQKSLTVVAAEAIFSGVLQQELKLNEHLLV